jgi:hypothetical protein
LSIFQFVVCAHGPDFLKNGCMHTHTCMIYSPFCNQSLVTLGKVWFLVHSIHCCWILRLFGPCGQEMICLSHWHLQSAHHIYPDTKVLTKSFRYRLNTMMYKSNTCRSCYLLWQCSRIRDVSFGLQVVFFLNLLDKSGSK